ncbi:MAG: 1,2-phenylacetyl-CoA epoxidase subunit A, partial [Bacteroidetes bacterium]|nr:1,2-phenylacetyl-CoA epoxidase subunit A [Bacteroidota bacterium]
YEHGPINWEEFFDVIKGNGPCNANRLKARVDADKNGAWVREAASAYAAKRAKERLVA